MPQKHDMTTQGKKGEWGDKESVAKTRLSTT